MRQIAFLHIESDPLWAEFIAGGVRQWPEVNYLGAATTIAAATRMAEEGKPELVLLDAGLPGADSFDAALRLQAAAPAPRVLLFTHRLAPYLLYRCLDSHIDGLLLKSLQSCVQLREALSTGPARKYFPEDVRQALARFRTGPAAFHKLLSPREVDLLRFLATEQSEAAISGTTGLAESTVRWHKYQIMAKLGLHRNAELIRWAHENGFVTSGHPASLAERTA